MPHSRSMTEFYATIARVQTMADGGLRVYLDLPEDAIVAAAEMMAYKRHLTVVDVMMTVHESVTDCNNEAEKEPEGSDSEVDSRRIAIRRDQ